MVSGDRARGEVSFGESPTQEASFGAGIILCMT